MQSIDTLKTIKDTLLNEGHLRKYKNLRKKQLPIQRLVFGVKRIFGSI